MVLFQLVKGLLAHDDQVLVLLHLAADTVDGRKVLGHLSVDQRDQKGFSDILKRIDCFLIVVDIDKSDHHALIIHFLDGNAGRCVIDQEQGIQFALSGLVIQHCIGRQKISHIQLLDLREERGPLHLDLDPDLLLIFGKSLSANCREDGRDRAAVVRILVDRRAKCIIEPHDLACLIQKRVGNIKVLQELALQFAVGSSEFHHFPAQDLAVIEIHIQRKDKIDHKKNGQNNADRPVNEVDQHGDSCQEQPQKNRYFEKGAEFLLTSLLTAHESVPPGFPDICGSILCKECPDPGSAFRGRPYRSQTYYSHHTGGAGAPCSPRAPAP